MGIPSRSEVNVMPGKGEIMLAGQLGDVDERISTDRESVYPFCQQRVI